jgi:hypothetical protein
VRESVEVGEKDTPSASNLPLVRTLVAHGVAETKAVELVATVEPETIAVQVEALPYRKPKDSGAVLASSIAQNWSLPSALTNERKKRIEQEQRAQAFALRAALDQKRAEVRSGVVSAFSGLPDAEKAHWRELARRQIQKEKPAFVKMSEGRAVLGEIIERRAAELSTAAAVASSSEVQPNAPTVREQVSRWACRAQNPVFPFPPGA